MDSGWKQTWHCNSIDLTLMTTRLLLQMMVIRMSVRGFWEVCEARKLQKQEVLWLGAILLQLRYPSCLPLGNVTLL